MRATLMAAIGLLVAGGSGSAAVTPVTVKITDTRTTISRTSVPTGVVVFSVSNAGRLPHVFRILGKSTPRLLPGRRVRLQVAVSVPGSYAYRASSVGVLHVVKPASAPTTATATATAPSSPSPASTARPCVNPSTTTVRVTMTDVQGGGGYAFSPLPIQCGTVTFVLVNNGQSPHSLGLTTPYGAELLDGPTVNANQTGTMTLNLSLSGLYEWHDSEGEGVETTFGYLDVQ
jgi:hypothetical protein